MTESWSRVPIDLHEVGGVAPRRILTTYSLPEAIVLGLIADRGKTIIIQGRRLGVDGTDSEAWPAIASSPNVRARPDTATPLYLISSSANDNAAGSGARLVAVEYIDAEGWCRFGVAVPTGTTATAVVQARVVGVGNAATVEVLAGPIQAVALRVNRAYVMRAGNASMAGSALAIIPASFDGRSWNFAPLSAIMIPRGRAGILYPGAISAATDRNANARCKVIVRQWGQPAQTWVCTEIAQGIQDAKLGVPVRIASMGEVVMHFCRDASGSAVDVYAGMQVVLLIDTSDPDPHPELLQPPFG